MSETHLQRATVLFFVGGVIALLFGIWPLTLTLVVAAFVLYARLQTQVEQRIAAATVTLLKRAATPPQAAVVETAQMHLDRLLEDAGLLGETDGQFSAVSFQNHRTWGARQPHQIRCRPLARQQVFSCVTALDRILDPFGVASWHRLSVA